MELVSNKEEMIFRNEYNGKVSYSLGLSKKKQDGSYEKGYINVGFKKGTELQNQTKIKIKQAWLDFYKKDKITVPIIFINDFEIVNEIQKQATNGAYTNSADVPVQLLNAKTESDFGGQIRIEDADLPF